MTRGKDRGVAWEQAAGLCRIWALAAFLWLALGLGGCATTPITLEDLAVDPDANRLPVSRLDDGLLTVPIDVGLDEPVPFVIDTGATKSVVFEDALPHLAALEAGPVRIHGMFGVDVVRQVALPRFALGKDEVENLSLAVLPQRKSAQTEGAPWGILGMDVLSRYRLFSPGRGEGLILLEAKGRAPVVPEDWGRVSLTESPYNDAARSLRFMDVRLNGRMTPALLDTGSSVNVLTYEFADFPYVRQARRRLEKRLELQGAVYEAKPRVIVEGVDFRAGSRVWWDRTFIVRDVEALEALGVVGEPFMIAGVDILADETFYLDLAGGELRMPKIGPPGESVTQYHSGVGILTGPEARSR